MSARPTGRPPPSLGDGRFLIIDALGDGGTAGVYLAWDTALNRWCAVKALLHRHTQDAEMRRRFSQEAHTLDQLSHPHIPRLFAWDATHQPPYLVMALARCGSTMDWVRENGAMPPSMAADVLFQICEALAEAHASGIVHRDVKPHNFLLDDAGHCKLTDFGIARVTDHTSLTATGSQIGTFSFMAPEQRSDTKSVDHRADIYSLGASLYTLVTARTSAELFVADKDDDLLEPVPPAFRDVVLTACRYRRDQRYDSALELQTALMNALSRIPADKADYPPLVRPRSPLPERPPEQVPVDRAFEDLVLWGIRPGSPPTEPPSPGRQASPDSGERSIPYIMPRREPTPMPAERAEVPAYVDISERGTLRRLADIDHKAHLEHQVQVEARQRRAAEAPPPRTSERVPTVLYAASVAGVAALGVAALVTLMLAAGIAHVGLARRQVTRTGAQLQRTLDDNVGVVYEMGGDRRHFEQLHERYRDARSADKAAHAAVLVAALAAAESAGAPTDREAEPKLDALRASKSEYDDALSAWVDAASGFPGGLATGIGLAPDPP